MRTRCNHSTLWMAQQEEEEKKSFLFRLFGVRCVVISFPSSSSASCLNHLSLGYLKYSVYSSLHSLHSWRAILIVVSHIIIFFRFPFRFSFFPSSSFCCVHSINDTSEEQMNMQCKQTKKKIRFADSFFFVRVFFFSFHIFICCI